MRIVGGALKGRRLSGFKGQRIRPTSDRAREAIFNILGPRFEHEKVLDLYAGTGAMGMEALSRGAAEAVFVDSDDEAVSLIEKNLKCLGLDKKARVIKKDCLKAIEGISEGRERFDLVFIDPPYAAGLLDKTLETLGRSGLVGRDGVVVAEASKRTPPPCAGGVLGRVDERRYGDTAVYFLRMKT